MARAQIVPIASRREMVAAMPPAPAETAAEPETLEAVAPVAAQPEPVAAPPAPVVEQPEVKPAAPALREKVVAPASAPAEQAAPAASAPAAKVEPKEAVATPEPKLEVKREAKSESKPESKPEPKPEVKKPAASAPATPDKPPAPARPATPVAPAAKVVIPEEPLAVEPAKSRKMLWVAVGVGVPALLLAGFFFSSGILHPGNRGIPAPGQDSSPLSLRIERNAGDIVLTWNRDSAAIQHATKAVLQIADGPQHENVDMDLAQLRNGSIVYSPVTGDVVFKMEVTGSNQSKTTSESVRVLRTRPSPMPDQPQEVQVTAKAPSAAPSAPAAAPQPAPSAPEEPAAQPEEEKVRLSAAVKPFSTDSLAKRLRPSRPADASAPDVPSVVAVPKMNDVNLGGLGGTTAAPLPIPSAPAPAPEKKGSAGSGGQIQQAELVYRKAPDYPKLARDSGASGIVELTATIGTNGRVKSVVVVKGHPLLRQAAVDAVKQWVYKPTILNGMPVEAQTQVVLNFKADR
jgi:protein TonB